MPFFLSLRYLRKLFNYLQSETSRRGDFQRLFPILANFSLSSHRNEPVVKETGSEIAKISPRRKFLVSDNGDVFLKIRVIVCRFKSRRIRRVTVSRDRRPDDEVAKGRHDASGNWKRRRTAGKRGIISPEERARRASRQRRGRGCWRGRWGKLNSEKSAGVWWLVPLGNGDTRKIVAVL